MSKNYSKWLLVSDIDGTLNNKQRQTPKCNITAIENFTSNGGNFTLCSGRNLVSLNNHYKKLKTTTPAICLNGAGIYDIANNKTIYYKPISLEGEKIILDLINKYKSLQLTIFDMETIYLYKRTCFYGFVVSLLDGIKRKLCLKEFDLPKGQWGKATIFGLPSVCKKVESILKSDENIKHLDCFFTSPVSLEIVGKGVNKGSAVSKLAEFISVNSENVAAIGDYYNDVAMLESVAHPVCCGQAPEDIKKLCEYVTCHCNDGAVNEFINYIEKNYI